ncbi:MAG: AI-2E family transporter [Spirochaetaceae bacterium]
MSSENGPEGGLRSLVFSRVSFVLILLGITVLFVFLVRRFIMPTLLAAITSALFGPLYRWVHVHVRMARVAAAVTLVIVLLVFVIPLGTFGYLAVDNLIAQLERIDENRAEVQQWVEEAVERLSWLPVIRRLDIDPWIEGRRILSSMAGLSTRLATGLGEVASGIGSFLLGAFIYLYCLYFFLKDGDRMLQTVFDKIPMRRTDKSEILSKFLSVTRATIKGTVVIGLFQGAIGGIVIGILGVPGALVWGVLLVFLAAIPNFGAVLVWLPISVGLFLQGDPVRGTLMVILGGGLVGLVDYLLRPRLIGDDIRIHEIFVLFGVLGGLVVFGVFGLIIGPIVMAVFVQLWTIYAELFRSELQYTSQSPSGEGNGHGR